MMRAWEFIDGVWFYAGHFYGQLAGWENVPLEEREKAAAWYRAHA